MSRKELKRFRENEGLCVYCGLKPFLKDKKGCENCLKKKIEITNKFAKSNPDRVKLYYLKVRFDVIEKYGGKCRCCGEDRLPFLTIDHINNDGNEERKLLYGSQSGNSRKWYFKLRKAAVREDLQVLCWNCNLAKCHFGVCPHVSQNKIDFSSLLQDYRRKGNFGLNDKIAWPTDLELLKLVRESNCSQVAKQLGVHDTAVRGRLKRRGLYESRKKENTTKLS